MKKILLVSMAFMISNCHQNICQTITATDHISRSLNRIERLMSRYERPFTALCLSIKDYTSILDCAHRYQNGVFVIMENECAEALAHRCYDEGLSNVVILNHKLSLMEIERLGECEHFDIVIACEPISSTEQRWQNIFEQIINLGEYTFITFAHDDETARNFIVSAGASCIKEESDFVLAVHHKEKTCLMRRRWNYFRANSPEEYAIKSNFTTKLLVKNKPGRKQAISTWNPGINLITFQILNGVYPTKKMIRRLLEQFRYLESNDFKIFNLIIGHGLTAIDCNEAGRNFDKDRELEHVISMFRSPSLLIEENIIELLQGD